jgi:glycerol uptake facilitator-like aquaporin
VSGGHFNPVISAVDWLLTRRQGNGLSAGAVAMYSAAQLVGAVLGALLANIMFDLPALQISGTDRVSLGHGLGELVATACLVLLVFALARTGRAALSAAAVGAYIGAAYWFTSSTSFANPAVTVGRIFSDTFAGIAPASALFFIVAQVLGGLVGLGLVRFFFPDAPVTAGRAVAPHPNRVPEES